MRELSKADPRLEALGTLDELTACLGLARAQTPDAQRAALLAALQQQLLALGSHIASAGKTNAERPLGFGEGELAFLERALEEAGKQLPPLHGFILPGASPTGAALHLARTVCRRAERRLVALVEQGADLSEALRYLNRLSDLLFALARLADLEAGRPEPR